MNQEPNSEAAETVQTTSVSAVDLPRLVLPSSDTPETDEWVLNNWGRHAALYDSRKFMEKLEREKNAAKAKRDELISFLETTITDCNKQADKFKESKWASAEYGSRAMATAYQCVLKFLENVEVSDRPS